MSTQRELIVPFSPSKPVQFVPFIALIQAKLERSTNQFLLYFK
jgi:hypothetical protein